MLHYQKKKKNLTCISPLSEDEQFEDALASPKLLAVSTVPKSKKELEDYNKLNNGFSTRINEING